MSLENVVIGDSISLGLNKEYPDISIIDQPVKLSTNNWNSVKLTSDLKKSGVWSVTKNLILSIGTNDLWVHNKKNSEDLISEIRRVFPNASYYILNGNYGWGDLKSTNAFPESKWKTKITDYIGFYNSSGFKTIGSITKLNKSPLPKDELYKSFNTDIERYILKSNNVQTTSTTTTTTTLPGGVVSQEQSRQEVYQTNQTTQSNSVPIKGIINIFKTTITPQTIDILVPDAEPTKKEMANGLGYIPVVWYNSYQIDAENIDFLSIYYDGMIPCMKLSFIDVMGYMKDEGFPLDDTKITFFLNSRSEQLKPVHLQFKIRTFANNNGLMVIDSILDIDGLYFKKFKSYPKMSSNKALQEVCKDIGLGFNTNINDTNDVMTWINTGNKAYDFMMDIIDRAYISDESFISGSIDLYYNFNYIDIQKELSRNIEEELGVQTLGISEVLGISEKENIGNLILTNDASFEGTNMYFKNYNIINNATSVAIERGYTDVIKYYNNIDKSLLNFNITSMNNNSDKSIILKGQPQDNVFFSQNVNYVYGGLLDSDNVHKNFNYSLIHNDRNIYDTQKVSMEMELTFPNFNIYKFQKIKVLLSSNTQTVSSVMVNQRLSGDWIVVDIRYNYYERGVRQILTMVKRELELSADELETELISIKKTPNTSGSRGEFSNPSESTDITSGPNISPSVFGRMTGKGSVTKNMTFEQATAAVISNLEGGYYHPDMLKDGRVRDNRYSSSGETMYGLDRKAGGDEISSCSPCRDFWGLLDKQGARTSWKWNYIPPDPLKTQLVNLATQIMKPIYEKNLKKYVPEKEIVDTINSDGRLMFNFVYATWNGPGWFKGWANEIRKAYKSGKTKSEDLVVLFVERRVDNRGIIGNNSNNSLVSQGGRKIAKIVGVDIT